MHDAIIEDAITNLRLSNTQTDSTTCAPSYCIVLDHFMPAIKGNTTWKHIRQQCANGHSFVSQAAKITFSDEPFLLICLENYQLLWNHQFVTNVSHFSSPVAHSPNIH